MVCDVLIGSALRANLDSTAVPLAEVKNSLFTTLVGFFADDSALMGLRESLSAQAGLGVVMGIFLALACGVCGCLASTCFVAKERMDADRPNPCVHRTSVCVWCCVLPFTALLFFTGGILTLIASPLCGICLVMDDLDSTLLRDISPAMGLSATSGDSFDMTMGILEQCFAVQNPLEAANLMDILFVTENGERKYVRQILVDDVTSQITGVFDDVSASLGGDSTSMADSEEVVNLVRLLRNNPVDAMIVPSVAQGEYLASAYPGLAQNVAQGGELSAAFVTSASCDNHVPSSEFDDSQTAIPGLTDLITNVRSTCSCTGGLQTCPNGPGSCADTSQACVDAQAYLALKRRLITEATYRCDIFENPNNALLTCDVKDMTNIGGTYSNDCMNNGAAPIRKSQTCNLADFIRYVEDFGTRITKVLERVDATVPLVADGINLSLRDLTDRYVVVPMQEIVDEATCGFLTEAYRSMVGGLCYQGVRGMRMVGVGYTMAAVLGLLMSTVMYAYWRRSVDNWNAWLDAKEGK